MAAYIILLLAMSYLSSKWSNQFKGIDSEMVVDLPSNITFNLKLCTLSSARKVAYNNMVLDVVISNVRATHELPLLCIASILTTCSCSKLTREPVEKESNTGPIIGYINCRHDNPSHYSLSIFISHLNILEDGKLTYQLLALAFVLSNVFSPCPLLFQCLL